MAQDLDGAGTAFTWGQALALPQVLCTSNGLRTLYGLKRLAVAQPTRAGQETRPTISGGG